MMLDLAETLNPLLGKRKERLDSGEEDDEDIADMTLQLFFWQRRSDFWLDWNKFHIWCQVPLVVPSLFVFNIAVRHLAEKWGSTYILPHQSRRLMDIQTTELHAIEHFILLDLLGAPSPAICSYFLDTAWLFDAMLSAERRLGDSGAFVYEDHTSLALCKWKSFFCPRTTSAINFYYIGGDHIPFLQKGISVLHIIPEPFPLVWHRFAVCFIIECCSRVTNFFSRTMPLHWTSQLFVDGTWFFESSCPNIYIYNHKTLPQDLNL